MPKATDDPLFKAAADLRRWMGEDDDVRTAVGGVCARMECATIAELAEQHPQMVLDLHAGFVDMFDEVEFLESLPPWKPGDDRPAE